MGGGCVRGARAKRASSSLSPLVRAIASIRYADLGHAAVTDALRDRQIADPADGSLLSGHLEGLDEDSRRALAGSPENS